MANMKQALVFKLHVLNVCVILAAFIEVSYRVEDVLYFFLKNIVELQTLHY